VVGTVPFLQQLQLTRALFTMTKSLGKIWKVHPNLEKAILDELFQKEGGKGVLKNLLYDLGVVMGLGGTAAFVVLTGGLVLSFLISVYIASAIAQARGASRLILVYSLLVMGIILYATAREPVASTNNNQQQQANGVRIGYCSLSFLKDGSYTFPSFFRRHKNISFLSFFFSYNMLIDFG
jgi:hypothetical protein